MIVAVVNQKGGTGKTTTTINLGKALCLKKKKVLLVDLDSQGNLSYSLGINEIGYPIGKLIEEGTFNVAAIHHREAMDVLATDNFLSEYEFTFIKQDYPFTILRDLLQQVKNNYDYIFIDCPPTVSYLTASALVAAESVLIPMQMDVLSIHGLNQLLYTIEEIKEELNPELQVLGILRVLVDKRRFLTQEALTHIESNYKLHVFKKYVRLNVKAAEAPSHGISVLEYAPTCNAAKDYKEVADEIVARVKNFQLTHT